MRRVMCVVAVCAAVGGVGAGAALADSPAQVASKGASMFNARFRLAGMPQRVTGMKCIREAGGTYFCTGLVGGARYYWSVKSVGDENIWRVE